MILSAIRSLSDSLFCKRVSDASTRGLTIISLRFNQRISERVSCHIGLIRLLFETDRVQVPRYPSTPHAFVADEAWMTWIWITDVAKCLGIKSVVEDCQLSVFLSLYFLDCDSILVLGRVNSMSASEGLHHEWLVSIQRSCRVGNLIQPIRSTTQIWVVKRHKYGIPAPVSQRSFAGETSSYCINII